MENKYRSLINKLRNDCSLIKKLDYEYRIDYNFLKACECLKDCLNYHEILNAKYKVIFGAYPTTPSFYQLSDADKDDELIVKPFILKEPFYLLDISERLQNDKMFIKNIVGVNKNAIQYVNHIFHDDIDIIKEVIKRYGLFAYNFASERLKSNTELIEYIKRNKKIFKEFYALQTSYIERLINLPQNYILKLNKKYVYFNFSKLSKSSIIKHLNTFPCYSHIIMWKLQEKWKKDLDIIEIACNINKSNILSADISVLENEEFINKLDISKGLKLRIESHIKSYKKLKAMEKKIWTISKWFWFRWRRWWRMGRWWYTR